MQNTHFLKSTQRLLGESKATQDLRHFLRAWSHMGVTVKRGLMNSMLAGFGRSLSRASLPTPSNAFACPPAFSPVDEVDLTL